MIYTLDYSGKYTEGLREPKQISLHMIDCIRHTFEKGYSYRSNLTQYHILLLPLSGCITFQDKEIPPGTLIYISKFCAYECETIESTDIIEITFDYSNDIPLFETSYRILNISLELQDAIKKLYANKFFLHTLPAVNDCSLLLILNTLNLSCHAGSGELMLYQKCCEWVEQHARTFITAEDAATAMNCTVAHLNRIIKKHSGKCLSTLIIERRIFEIKQMCNNTDFSSNKIAQALGFESAELLRKFFKYHTGMSLRKYREN